MPSHVSVENQLAEDLQRAMGMIIEEHPQSFHYQDRLVHAAIAGFLSQLSCKDPFVVRHDLGSWFFREASCPL